MVATTEKKQPGYRVAGLSGKISSSMPFLGLQKQKYEKMFGELLIAYLAGRPFGTLVDQPQLASRSQAQHHTMRSLNAMRRQLATFYQELLDIIQRHQPLGMPAGRGLQVGQVIGLTLAMILELQVEMEKISQAMTTPNYGDNHG